MWLREAGASPNGLYTKNHCTGVRIQRRKQVAVKLTTSTETDSTMGDADGAGAGSGSGAGLKHQRTVSDGDNQKINSLFCPLRETLGDSYSFLDLFYFLFNFSPLV